MRQCLPRYQISKYPLPASLTRRVNPLVAIAALPYPLFNGWPIEEQLALGGLKIMHAPLEDVLGHQVVNSFDRVAYAIRQRLDREVVCCGTILYCHLVHVLPPCQ